MLVLLPDGAHREVLEADERVDGDQVRMGHSVTRPKKYDGRIATNIRIPKELHKRYLAEGKRRDVSVNYLLVRALEREIDNFENQELP